MEVVDTDQVEIRCVRLLVETILTAQLPPPGFVTTRCCLALDDAARLHMVRLADGQ